jgi:multicomponent Na+:H+ antiporter subunit D
MQLNLVFTAAFVILTAAIALLAATLPACKARAWFPLALGSAALVVAGQNMPALWAKTLLLTCAEVAAVGLVWCQGTLRARQAATTFLVMVLAGGLLTTAITLFAPAPPATASAAALLAALFLVGWALKLALAPFYFWLPAVAEVAAPLSTALIVAVIDIAAFLELVHVSESLPWLIEAARPLWLAVALISMFGGAFLALAQRDVKRMLAFSTIDDMGYLLLGALLLPSTGMAGALIGALAHGIFKALLFGAVAVAEGGLGRPLTLDAAGLLSRFPVAGAAFIAGSLGMLGVPPLLGFAGRWRLYLSAAEGGSAALILAMMAATGLALCYYVRGIHRVWLGPGDAPVTRPEPRLAQAVLLALITLGLVLGLAPGWLIGWGA